MDFHMNPFPPPFLTQIEFNIPELVAAVGVSGAVLILIVYAIFRIALAEVAKSSASNAADVEQQRTMTQMVVNTSTQVAHLQERIMELSSQIVTMTSERTRDREQYTELKGKYDIAQLQIGILEEKVKAHEKQIAKLQTDNEYIAKQRDKLREERDELQRTLQIKQDQIAYLQGQNSVLNNRVNEYRTWQQHAVTQPISDDLLDQLDTLETDTGNTPILATNGDSDISTDNDSTQDNKSDNNELKDAS